MSYKALVHLISDYSLAADKEKLPNSHDCLIEIERILLYNLFKLFRGRKSNKKVKAAELIGPSMSCYIHGDKSLFDTTIKLANRTFNKNVDDEETVILRQGNFGKLGFDGEDGAGQMRYVEVGCNKELSKFFNYLEKGYIKFRKNEVNDEKNIPYHLPYMVPIGLVGNSVSFFIGGLNSTIMPQFKLNDLLKRQYELVKNGNSDFYPKPVIDGCYVMPASDDPDVFKRLFIEGRGKVYCIPIFEKFPKNRELILKGKHPKKGFGKIYKGNENIENVSKNRSSLNGYNRYYKHVNGVPYFKVSDLTDIKSENYYDLEISIKPTKGIDFDAVFVNKIMSLVSENITFNCKVIDQEEIETRENNGEKVTKSELISTHLKTMPIDKMLIDSFNRMKGFRMRALSDIMKTLNSELRTVEIAKVIAEVHYSNNEEIKKNPLEEYETVIRIYERDYYKKTYDYSVNEFVAVLDSIKLKTLYKRSFETQPIIDKIELVDKKINSLHDDMLDEIKKYF